MKSLWTLFLLLGFMIYWWCTEAPAATPSVIAAKQGILEVIQRIPKDRVVYETPPPKQDDEYRILGSAFLTPDGEYVSAAELFSLSKKSYSKDFYLRDQKGSIYPIKTITRYHEALGVITFRLKDHPEGVKPLQEGRPPLMGQAVCIPSPPVGEALQVQCGEQIIHTKIKQGKKILNRLGFSGDLPPQSLGGPLLNEEGQAMGVIVKLGRVNLALPFREQKRLTSRYAYFYQKDTAIVTDGFKSTKKEFRAKARLPRSLYPLHQVARKALFKHYKGLLQKHRKTYASELFPHHKGLTRLFYQPEFTKGAQVVYPVDATLRHWGLKPLRGRRIPIGEDQALEVLSPYQGLKPFHMDRAPGQPLDSFLNYPERMIEEIMRVTGLSRDIDGSRYPLKSLGPKEKLTGFFDLLGRRWFRAEWRLAYNETLIHLYYTPTVKGAYAFVDFVPLQSFHPMHYWQRRFDLSHVVFAYQGSSHEMAEFMRLKAKPKPFYDLSLVHDDDYLRLQNKHLYLEWLAGENPRFDHLTLHLGFGMKNRNSAQITGFHYQPDLSQYASITALLSHRPPPYMKRERRDFIKKAKHHAPFDGQMRETIHGYEINRVIPLPPTPSFWLVSCRSLDELLTEESCDLIIEPRHKTKLKRTTRFPSR